MTIYKGVEVIKKQRLFLVLLTVVAGLIGGVISNQFLTAQEQNAPVMEAESFIIWVSGITA